MIKIYNTHWIYVVTSTGQRLVKSLKFILLMTPANVYILLLLKSPFVSRPIKYLLSQIIIVFDRIPPWKNGYHSGRRSFR